MTKKLRLANEGLRFAQEQVTDAEKMLVTATYFAITQCKHTTVGEAPYKPNNHLRSLPPFRVCMSCGLTEEGWSCGYIVLDAELTYNLTRDQGYDLRTVLVEDDDKGPLLRKETTLQQLVKKKLNYEK
jgi:hypothetical protein